MEGPESFEVSYKEVKRMIKMLLDLLEYESTERKDVRANSPLSPLRG